MQNLKQKKLKKAEFIMFIGFLLVLLTGLGAGLGNFPVNILGTVFIGGIVLCVYGGFRSSLFS